MRNDNHRWDAPGELAVKTDGLTVAPVKGLRQTLVSGLDVLAKYYDHLITWPDVAEGESYALSLRRDRILIIGETDLRPGFDAAKGWAVSDLSDGYAVFDLYGPRAFEVLRRGAELRIDQPSRSVARRLFSFDVVLYQSEKEGNFRIHVSRSFGQALVQSLSN